MVRLADETDWNRGHAGSMDFIDNRLNGRSGTIRGRAVIANKDLFLLPGTFGHLRLLAGTTEALLIPDTTIASDQASKIVLTVGPGNVVAAKTVTLGPIHEGLRVVLSGLPRDARVVIAGVANPFVRPGAVVEPREGTITLAAASASK
jgi:multidrug efflux pump subunit AcrA (membrane-fusion protein)